MGNSILRRFSSSIVLRSALLVVFISGVVGYGLINQISNYVEDKIQQNLSFRIAELVKTVESTAQIACYLGDTSLAKEVAKGLLNNRDVERVVIRNERGTLIDLNRSDLKKITETPLQNLPPDAPPMQGKPDSILIPPQNSIVRNLSSPFKPETAVGEILVVRNETEIALQVQEYSAFIRLLIIMQTGAIILVVTLISVGYIAHPIHQISRRLNSLSAVDGQKLDVPSGHAKNEIGQLVTNVNLLIDKLVGGILAERELRHKREQDERRFRAIFENAETGIFVIDHEGILSSYNASFGRTLRPGQAPTQPNGSISLLDLIGSNADRIKLQIETCILEKITVKDEIKLSAADDTVRWVNIILNPVEDNQIQGVINDITESKMREALANKLALTDALTGLGNRLGFERHIDALISEKLVKPTQNFTLMMIDLDRFKQVNDTHGHDVGDAILEHVARSIEHSVRKADFAARLGGDEFVLLLSYVADEAIAIRLAQNLINNISRPIVTKTGISTSVGASIGICLVRDPNMRREEIIKQADLALYEVKNSGRNGFKIYSRDSMSTVNAA